MAPKDSKKQQQQQQSVVVSPLAFTTMFLHASLHSTSVVHGALLGTTDNSKLVVTITDAIPICHEHPTKPLVEMSLALIQAHHCGSSSSNNNNNNNKTVVGWYTAPERLDDERPGAAALRIVASLATASSSSGGSEPVLVVLRNGPMAKQVLQSTTDASSSAADAMMLAFGKDFGQQWLQPLSLQVDQEAKARKTARDSFVSGNVTIVDLVDHFESPTAAEWSLAPSV